MFKRTFVALIVCTMAAGLVPTGISLASDTDIQLVSVMRQEEPITYYITEQNQIATLDPQIASDLYSNTVIEQLFLGITDSDPVTPGNINPELATSWIVSEDGLQWTFTIRNDVPWVHWDPTTHEGSVLRNVTADDIAYGIKRACDPRLSAYYTSIADKVILGCNDLSQKAIEEVTDADYDLVQVSAPDSSTLVVNLQYSAGFFFSQTPMWMYKAVPREVIEEYGNDWTEVGNIVTNGPFVLDEFVRGVRWVYLSNPYLPDDLRGPGNVERVVVTQVEDLGTIFALYQDNQIDRSGVPAAEVQSVLSDPQYADQLSQTSTLGVGYLGLAHDKAPFDNVHVRRAFSASIDREAYIQEIRQGRGIPMIHFTPPGIFGAPPINEVGVGYDPEFALQEIGAAGYPNCQGLPPIVFVVSTGQGPLAEFVAASVERELGCDPNTMTIEQQEFTVLLELIKPQNAIEDRPNIWAIGWSSDYPDANNWVADVLSCEAENDQKRPCSEVDDLITQAARETDPNTRVELYYQIEDMFFGPDGEQPIIPLYLGITFSLTKPWVTGPFDTDGLFGGPHYDWRTIDQAAQLAGRGS